MDPMLVIFLAIIFVMLLKVSGKSRKAKLIDKLPGPAGVPILGNALQLTVLDTAGIKKEDSQRKSISNRIVQQNELSLTLILKLSFMNGNEKNRYLPNSFSSDAATNEAGQTVWAYLQKLDGILSLCLCFQC